MRILLTNDDGINAEGINKLYDFLKNEKNEVFIVAPDKDNSAVSHSITLGQKIIIKKVTSNKYSMTGTPADCIMIGFKLGLFKDIDLVISGINRGGNMGEDVHYSGTVAAALEAGFLGFPSMAISINSKEPKNYEAIFPYITELIDITMKLDKRNILNANYADQKKLKRLKWTTLGSRHYVDHIDFKNSDKKTIIALNKPSKSIPKLLKDSDYWAVYKGFVSITPFQLDWTNIDILKRYE
jgi:5'-nucleotidase